MARPASSTNAPCNASTSGVASVGSGKGLTRARRNGSEPSSRMSATRSMPSTSSSTVPSAVRFILRMSAFVPTGYRSFCVGDSTEESFCEKRTISFSSVANAASTAASEVARPTESGISRYGKRTVFLSGKTGNSGCSLCFSSDISIVLSGHAAEQHPDQQDAVVQIHDQPRALQGARQFHGPLESIPGDLHRVKAAALLHDVVPPQAADADTPPLDRELNIFAADTRQIEAQQPPGSGSEDIDRRLPNLSQVRFREDSDRPRFSSLIHADSSNLMLGD